MEMFRKWLENMSNEELMGMVVQLSTAISNIRNKPFCTIQQLEDMQNDLDINRILLKLTFEELHNISRELSEEDAKKLGELLSN